MIRGDSKEYELLDEWVKTLPFYSESPHNILTCEIGVREGLGSQIIMSGIKSRLPGVRYKHIAIDPYNNIKYQHYDDSPAYTAEYTNEMMKQMEIDFKDYPEFKFHHMTDIKFMETHPEMGPFDLVFLDGPHMTKDVMTEAIWFANRSRRGTRLIFDDHNKYDMSIIAYALTVYGFKTIECGETKICLEKKK